MLDVHHFVFAINARGPNRRSQGGGSGNGTRASVLGFSAAGRTRITPVRLELPVRSITHRSCVSKKLQGRGELCPLLL
jgi:hypothetical protein